MQRIVLYVEDNPSNVVVVERIIESLGYSLKVATDGRTGLEMAFSIHPSLILMDIGLPDVDGLEATAQLRSQPHTRNIPIIAVTAHAMNGDREKCLEAGCNDYLAKPFQVKSLKTMVETYLGTKTKE